MIYKIKQYILDHQETFQFKSKDISFILLTSNAHKKSDYAKIVVLWFQDHNNKPFLISKIAKNSKSAQILKFEHVVSKNISKNYPNIAKIIDSHYFNHHFVSFEKAIAGISWPKIIEKCKQDDIEKISRCLFDKFVKIYIQIHNNFSLNKNTECPYNILSDNQMLALEESYDFLSKYNWYNCDLIPQNIYYDKKNDWIIDLELTCFCSPSIPVFRFFNSYFHQILTSNEIITDENLSHFRNFIYNQKDWLHKLCLDAASQILGTKITFQMWLDLWKYFLLWEIKLQSKVCILPNLPYIKELQAKIKIIDEDIFIKDQKIFDLENKLKNLLDREKENAILKARIAELESSTSWKLTEPLRQSVDAIKKTTVNTRISTKKHLDKISPLVPRSIKQIIKPIYHKLFSGIPNHHVLPLTLDKVDQNLIDDTHNRSTMLDIFVWPVIDWQGRWQRPQQLISRLADRGHRVFYFSASFHQTSESDPAKAIKIGNVHQNIYQIQLPLASEVSIYQDILTDSDLASLQKSIDVIKDKFKINHAVSIVHQPFWYPLVKQIKSNKIVYDCMDDHAGFVTNSSHQSILEDELFQKSDLVITTSKNLFEKATHLNQNTALIRNGSDIPHFSILPPCQESLLKKPIIGYYGAISDWFDTELLAKCARRYPDYSFVLIGSTYGADLREIEKIPNIHILGEKSYQELPNYLTCFDVCLIPFKINNLTLATNPVKFYEYISSGKPVVTVDLPELKDRQDICYLSLNHDEFIANIQKALEENNSEMVGKRKAVALANSWKSRVDEFENQIFNLFPPVSIVTLSYNNLELTKNCIESIYKYSRYPNFELIVIDNASTDEAPVYLRSIEKQYPHLKIIFNQENLGFAKANNQGIKIAKGKYLILINNDTVVTNDWIVKLVNHMEHDQNMGLLGPVTNSIGNEQQISVDYQNIDGLQQFAWDYCFKNIDKLTEIKMLALYCAIATKEVLSKVGNISEEYEIGMFEDDDLSQKIKQTGKKVVMTDDVFVHHHGRASFAKLDDQKYMAIFNKNKQIYEKKWGPWRPHQIKK